MPADNNEFIDAIREVVGTTVRKHRRKISGSVAAYMADTQIRLERLYERRANDEIDEAFFQDRLEEEKQLLRMHLIELKVMGKVATEELVNGIFVAVGGIIRSII